MKKSRICYITIVVFGMMVIRLNAGKEPVKNVPQFIALKRQKSNSKELKLFQEKRSFELLKEEQIEKIIESPKRYIKRKNSRLKELLEEYKKQKADLD